MSGRAPYRALFAWSWHRRSCSARPGIGSDRLRDARHLARLLHLGEITEIAVSRVEQEAARDLVRAREDVRGDLMSARHRVSKLLLRQGMVYYQGKAWTGAHDRLRSQHLDLPGLQLAFDVAYDTVLATVARRDRLDAATSAMAADSEFTAVVTRLGCLHGVSTLTAFGLAVEIGNWHRLDGRSIGAYLGLVPTESSSGGSRSQGAGDQDRQRPREAVADRSRVAPPRCSDWCGMTVPGSGPRGAGCPGHAPHTLVRSLLLIDLANSPTRIPSCRATRRGNDRSATTACQAPGITGPDEPHDGPTQPIQEHLHPRFCFFPERLPSSVGVKAVRPLRGLCAVGLRPSPDPDA